MICQVIDSCCQDSNLNFRRTCISSPLPYSAIIRLFCSFVIMSFSSLFFTLPTLSSGWSPPATEHRLFYTNRSITQKGGPCKPPFVSFYKAFKLLTASVMESAPNTELPAISISAPASTSFLPVTVFTPPSMLIGTCIPVSSMISTDLFTFS